MSLAIPIEAEVSKLGEVGGQDTICVVQSYATNLYLTQLLSSAVGVLALVFQSVEFLQIFPVSLEPFQAHGWELRLLLVFIRVSILVDQEGVD